MRTLPGAETMVGLAGAVMRTVSMKDQDKILSSQRRRFWIPLVCELGEDATCAHFTRAGAHCGFRSLIMKASADMAHHRASRNPAKEKRLLAMKSPDLCI